MAYLKIFPIKVTDKKALDYITNPDKTDEKLLVSSFGCSPETADLEFSMTREMEKRMEWTKAIIICAFSAQKNEEWSRTIAHLLQDFSCNINKKI